MIVYCLVVAVCSFHLAHGRDRYHEATRLSAQVTGLDKRELDASYWLQEAATESRMRAKRIGNNAKAKSVVLFLGDGMSMATLTAARTLREQREGLLGGKTRLGFETFSTVGLAKTYCVDAQVPDSACTATAYLCGVKCNLGTIGVTARVQRGHCRAARDRNVHLNSIAAWALEDGRNAGIVTTTRVTHASPSGAYVHSAERFWESDADMPSICKSTGQADHARQLIEDYPGKNFKVIFGGGRREFLPEKVLDEEGDPGRRKDGRNLLREWEAARKRENKTYRYVWNRDQLLEASKNPPEYLLGLFESSHLRYHLLTNATTEPTLAEMTEAAIRSLSRNPRGFFLFVEGGRIDHAHHDNQPALALDETLEMDAAVMAARRLLPESEALLLVTADHAHVMTFNGYTRRGRNILGPSDDIDKQGVSYMTLSYANGPGWRSDTNGSRRDVTKEDDFMKEEWRTHADAPLNSETHGGDDVAVFALGPRHELFSGLYEQTHVAHRAALAACLGPYRDCCGSAAACSDKSSYISAATLVSGILWHIFIL